MNENQIIWDSVKQIPVFNTPNEFSLFIENRASELNINHVEMLLTFCEEYSLEPDDIAHKVNHSLREKLEQDFRNLNYLPKKAQLDL